MTEECIDIEVVKFLLVYIAAVVTLTSGVLLAAVIHWRAKT